jgi:signal transduction histidine kinase
MASIIENLLTLSKAERGTIELHRELLQLDQIVLELFEDSAILASKKNITVDLRHVDEITINGDKVRLRQLLLNLLDNAIKFTPENGRVMLALIRTNGEAQIIVEDTGIGIPEEDLPRIFDRFYRVEKGRSREMGGSGLGLAIAQWVVHAHNGSIEVQSQPHAGTTFTVHLPC